MRHLFIGGPHDGERHDVPHRDSRPQPVWTLRHRVRPSYAYEFLNEPQFDSHWDWEKTTYVPMLWKADGKPFWVFVLPEAATHPDYVMDELLNGYKRR